MNLRHSSNTSIINKDTTPKDSAKTTIIAANDQPLQFNNPLMNKLAKGINNDLSPNVRHRSRNPLIYNPD
jgi:hypothetical protein